MFSSVFVPFKGPFRRFEITAPRRVEPGGLSGPSASVASADPAIDWTTSAALCTASQLSPAMGWDGQTISGSGTRKSAINRCAYIYMCVCVNMHICVWSYICICAMGDLATRGAPLGWSLTGGAAIQVVGPDWLVVEPYPSEKYG